MKRSQDVCDGGLAVSVRDLFVTPPFIIIMIFIYIFTQVYLIYEYACIISLYTYIYITIIIMISLTRSSINSSVVDVIK